MHECTIFIDIYSSWDFDEQYIYFLIYILCLSYIRNTIVIELNNLGKSFEVFKAQVYICIFRIGLLYCFINCGYNDISEDKSTLFINWVLICQFNASAYHEHLIFLKHVFEI